MSKRHFRWFKIQSYENMAKGIKRYVTSSGKTEAAHQTYRAKIKLHGTNAAVVITPECEVYAQSRGRILTPENDNYNFATWVKDAKIPWENLLGGKTVIIFGEWSGQGVNDGCAIHQAKYRFFAIFSIQVIGEETNFIMTDPQNITTWLKQHSCEHPELHVLPWYGKPFDIGFFQDNLESVDYLNEMVAIVEQQDPWAKKILGLDGIGEGIVCYPYDPNKTLWPTEIIDYYIFKAKGEKHRVSKQCRAVDPSKVPSNDELEWARTFTTEARLAQGLEEITKGDIGEIHIKNTGKFIGWISQDVYAEHKPELEEANLEWKRVAKLISKIAKDWYFTKLGMSQFK